MALELWNTLATFGTFLVIAATAIAAIVQLRHARSSNQIAALNELRETSESPQFTEAQDFVLIELAERMNDPGLRHQLVNREARTNQNQAPIAKIRAVGNFYDSIGLLIKAGFVDREIVLQIWCENVQEAWEQLESVAAIVRRKQGSKLWEDFEYVAVLSQDWIATHPNGSYPAGVRRIKVKDKWVEDDAKYAASPA
jgi:hypothetical protein